MQYAHHENDPIQGKVPMQTIQVDQVNYRNRILCDSHMMTQVFLFTCLLMRKLRLRRPLWLPKLIKSGRGGT